MHDATDIWNSPSETPDETLDNIALNQLVEYLNSGHAAIDDSTITDNLASLLNSNVTLFQNALEQLCTFFESSTEDKKSIFRKLIISQLELLNKKIVGVGLDESHQISSEVEEIKTPSCDTNPYPEFYTKSAQLFVKAYQTATTPLAFENDSQRASELINYAHTLFMLPLFLETENSFRRKATVHFIVELQNMFQQVPLCTKILALLGDYLNNRLSLEKFQPALSGCLIALYDATSDFGDKPYNIAIKITAIVLNTCRLSSEEQESYLRDANTYVYVTVPKRNHIGAFLQAHHNEKIPNTTVSALSTYLRNAVDTHSPLVIFKLQEYLNTLSHGPAATYIRALHTIAYIQTHGSTQNNEIFIKQYISHQLSMFAATTDDLPLEARLAITSILNILLHGLLMDDPKCYFQDPKLVRLLSQKLDAIYPHAQQHCKDLLHLTAIAMLAYQYETETLSNRVYQTNVRALLGITEYFEKISTCVDNNSHEIENRKKCNTIASVLQALSFTNDETEYQSLYQKLVSKLQDLSKHSTPLFLGLLENSARIVARLRHQSDPAYFRTVIYEFFQASSLLEALQVYNAMSIPENTQILDDELIRTTSTFIQNSQHRLHQQLLEFSLKLKRPIEFHAVFHTIALRYALTTEQNFAENYQQFKDQLVQQHIHLYIQSLLDLYPKFARALLNLETHLFREIDESDNNSITTMCHESITTALSIANHSIPLLHEVSHIIATRFSCTEEVYEDNYLTIRQQIVSRLLESPLDDICPELSDLDEELDDTTSMKSIIDECFRQKNPLEFLRDNTEDIKKQLHQIYQTSSSEFYAYIAVFNKGFEYSNISLEELDEVAPYFKAYFVPHQAIQTIRGLKSKANASNINHAIEEVAKYFETGLAAANPKSYFETKKAELAHHLQQLQWTPSSLWNSLLNAITSLVCHCLSIFGTPAWLNTQLNQNQRIKGDRYLFFTGGQLQQAKIESYKTSLTIKAVEREILYNPKK